jgi:hypothetical protein
VTNVTFAFGTAGALIVTPGPTASGGLLREEILLLVSCGGEMNRYRDISSDVIRRLDHVLRFDLRTRFNLNQWDYRLDPSRDEPVGHVQDRSLKQVDESEGVVAILGRTVPRVTRLEIRRVFELRQLGQSRELWVFIRPPSRTAVIAASSTGDPTVPEFVDEIGRDFGRELLCPRNRTELDFQASLMTTLVPFLFARVGVGHGPLGMVG